MILIWCLFNLGYWVPLLGVLSNLCGDQRPEV